MDFDLFEETTGISYEMFLSTRVVWTIENWLRLKSPITQYEQEKFPNAKLAAEIKNSPLYQLL